MAKKSRKLVLPVVPYAPKPSVEDIGFVPAIHGRYLIMAVADGKHIIHERCENRTEMNAAYSSSMIDLESGGFAEEVTEIYRAIEAEGED